VGSYRCRSPLGEKSDNKWWAKESSARITSHAKTRTREFSRRTLNSSKSCLKQQARSTCAPMTKAFRPIRNTSQLLPKRHWFNKLSELQVQTTVHLPRSLESSPKLLSTKSFQMFQRINNYRQFFQRIPIHLGHLDVPSLSRDSFPHLRYENNLIPIKCWLATKKDYFWCLRHSQRLLDPTLMLSHSRNQRLYRKWKTS